MEQTTELLVEALAPYRVVLGGDRPDGGKPLSLLDESGEVILTRVIQRAQWQDRRLLTDVVDSVLRDLLVHQGRLAPDVIASLRGSDRVRSYGTLR